ncbi:MAG: radical SAM domain-containing protein [Methanosaeta sp. NSM2]|nr:radical SAM protein [Methanothrix sp.]MDD1732255.1 radical SAM protein [Methanothrix sp.]OYV12860.1 MAG: radical SAM domain-containing protein [Methanosaeta sp. NSM2]
MQITKKPLLRIEAFQEKRGIRLEGRGPAAPLARPILERMNRIFADEKPISAGPDRFIFSTWIPPAPSIAFERMLSAQVAALSRRPVPDQFSIAVMKACPNDCIHCSAPSRQGQILESSLVKSALSQALDMGSYLITFDGGEPMLRHDLPELVSSVDARAVAASFTSGYHLSAERARELKQAGLYAVRISIDSPREEEHDRIRGRAGAYGDALSGVKNALEAGLLVDLFMVTSPHNIDLLEEAFSLASDLGVHELSLYEIVAVGRWATHESEVLSDSDVLRLERFHKDKNRSEGPRVTALPYLLGPEMFGCFAGRRWIHVDGDGEALPCAYMPLSFGNIRDKSLKEIWKDMTSYQWFQGRCSCQMREPKFREAHRDILKK